MTNIRLHKEYGLNPTLPICIICNEEKGDIALLGNAFKGEAPKHMLLDIEPCQKCRDKYLKSGTLLVEVEADRHVPTGSVTVIKDTAFKLVFNQDVPPQKIVKVEVGILQELQRQQEEANREYDNGKS
jgi:hypothetical protein